jgi:hypothetical protein
VDAICAPCPNQQGWIAMEFSAGASSPISGRRKEEFSSSRNCNPSVSDPGSSLMQRDVTGDFPGCPRPDFTRRANQQNPVKPCLQKYSDFQNTQISRISFSVPFLPKGRLAIVTDAERDAVDVECALDERRVTRTAKSCGPDASRLASSRRIFLSADDGVNKARSPGRARSSQLKPSRGECRVIPV